MSSGTHAKPATRARRRRWPDSILLLLHALRLSLGAQKLRRSGSLKEVGARLASRPGLPRRVEPAAALLAASRAGRILQNLGFLNSCLMRSLVAGVLLSDRDEVVLHVGVQGRDQSTGGLTGHAWLTLKGSIVPAPEEVIAPNGRRYEEMASLLLRRPPRF